MKKILLILTILSLSIFITACNVDISDSIQPVISAFDKTITVGDDFDPHNNVYAVDNVDGVISVSITANNVDTNTVGVYSVTYQATDSSNNIAEKTIEITVVEDTTIDNIAPIIFASNKTIYVNETINLLSGVTANDNVDGNISVTIQSNDLDNSTPGIYYVTFYASDIAGNEATKTISITVLVEVEEDVNAPTIYAENKTVYQNTEIDLLEGVIATDDFDDDVLIAVHETDLDITKTGEYYVTYSATDDAGNVSYETITLLVIIDPTYLSVSNFNVLDNYKLAPSGKQAIVKVSFDNPNNYKLESVTISGNTYTEFLSGSSNKDVFIEVNLPELLREYTLIVESFTFNINGNTETGVSTYSDTLELYGEISTPQDLQDINLDLNAKYFLINDIDMDGFDFEPLGSEFEGFKGQLCSLDSNQIYPTCGGNYTISNLNITKEQTFVGLFEYIASSGIVSNLELYNADINNINTDDSLQDKTAAIAGINEGTITNINVLAYVNGYIFTGGIAGVNNGYISNINFTGVINSHQYAGGITARNIEEDIYYVSVEAIINIINASPQYPIKDSNFAGGIAGENFASIYASNVVVSIDVASGNYSYAGGIAGYSHGSIHNNNIDANVRIWGEDYAYVGGIAGYTNNTDVFSNIVFGSNQIEVELYGNIGGAVGFIENTNLYDNLLLNDSQDSNVLLDLPTTTNSAKVANYEYSTLTNNLVFFANVYTDGTINQGVLVDYNEIDNINIYNEILNDYYWEIDSTLANNIFPVVISDNDFNYEFQYTNPITFSLSDITSEFLIYEINDQIELTINIFNYTNQEINSFTINGINYTNIEVVNTDTYKVIINAINEVDIQNINLQQIGYYSNLTQFYKAVNESITIQTIDTTAPTFNIDDQTIEAGLYLDLDFTDYIYGEDDNSLNPLILTEVSDNVDYNTPGTYSVTVSVSDQDLNTTQATFNVIVEDTTNPEFNVDDQTIEAGVSDIDFTNYIYDESDNTDGLLTFSEIVDNTDYDTPGIYTVTLRVTDESLNYTEITINVTVEDTTAPSFSIDDQTIEAGGNNIDFTTFIYNILDNTDGIITLLETTDTVDYNTPGTYVVSLKAIDESLNETTISINIFVIDTTAPTFSIDDQTIEAGSNDIDFSNYVYHIVENTDIAVTIIETEDLVDYDTIGVYSVTITVTDNAGNFTSQTINVTVEDTILPTFTIENQTIESGVSDIDFTALITNINDNSDAVITLLEVSDLVDYNTPGIYNVTVSASDLVNTREVTITVTVVDTTDPTYDINNQTIEAGVSNIDFSTFITNPSDNSDTALTATEVSDYVDYNTPGTYNVIVRLSDNYGNYTNTTITVTVVDTTPPTFDITDQTFEAGAYTTFNYLALITNVNDNSDTSLNSELVSDLVDYNTAGTYQVTVKVYDASLNEQITSINVTIVDTIAPTFDDINDQTIESGSDIDWTTYITNTSDNTDDILVLSEIDLVDYNTPGTYLVTVVVTDISLNETQKSFNVTVIDTTAPTAIPVSYNVEAGTSNIDWATYILVTENSDIGYTATEIIDNIDYNTVGTYQVQVRIIDETGNENIESFMINIIDTTAPTFTPFIDQEREQSITDVNWSNLITGQTDNSDGYLIAYEEFDNVDYNTPGTYTVRVVLEDESGNSTYQDFNVTIIAEANPTFDLIPDQEREQGVSDVDWTTIIENVSDNVNRPLTIIEVQDNVNYLSAGTYSVTVRVTDEVGNYTEQTFNVTIAITADPAFDNIANDQYIEAGDYTDFDWTTLITNATDNVDRPLTFIEFVDNVDYDTPGDYNVTVRVYDEAGNFAQDSFIVHVTDTTDPTFDFIEDQTIEEEHSDIWWPDLIQNESDNSDALLTKVEVVDGVNYNTPGTYTVTVLVADASGNNYQQSFSVTVIVVADPTFDPIGDQVIEAGEFTDIDWTTYILNALDNVTTTNNLVLSEDLDNIDYDHVGTYSVTVSVTDESGHDATETFTVTVLDTQAPTFNLQEQYTIPLELTGIDVDWSQLIDNISDNSDDSLDISDAYEVLDTIIYDKVGTYFVKVALVDNSGNINIQTFWIEYIDTTAPTFDIPATITREVGIAPLDFTSFITNLVEISNDQLIYNVYHNINYSAPGTYSVTISVADESGNITFETFDFILEAAEAPTFDLEEGPFYVIEAGEYSDYDWTTHMVNLNDNLIERLGEATTYEVEDNIDYDTPGIYSVTVKMVDEANNETSLTFNVTVVDTTSPTYTYSFDNIIEAGFVTSIDWCSLITTYDNADLLVTCLVLDDDVDFNTPATYTLLIKLQDGSLNETIDYIYITIIDTTEPVYDTILDQTIESGDYLNIDWTTYILNLSDNSDTFLVISEDLDNVDYNTPGTYSVTVSVTDQSSNSHIQTFNVTVEDTINPTFDPIADQTIEAGPTDVDWTTLITNEWDNSDTALTKLEVVDNVDYDTPGTYSVTVRLQDNYGNSSEDTFNVTVEDTTPPTFDPIGTVAISAGSPDIDWTTYMFNQADNSDGILTATEVEDNVLYDTIGTYTVTVRLEDEDGNFTEETFNVNVT